jgi:hypothetical protein
MLNAFVKKTDVQSLQTVLFLLFGKIDQAGGTKFAINVRVIAFQTFLAQIVPMFGTVINGFPFRVVLALAHNFSLCFAVTAKPCLVLHLSADDGIKAINTSPLHFNAPDASLDTSRDPCPINFERTGFSL